MLNVKTGKRTLVTFWLCLSVLIAPFSFVLLLAAAWGGQGMSQQVIAYIQNGLRVHADISYLEVNRGLSARLRNTQAGSCCLIWSTDGSQLMFTRYDVGGYTAKIYLMNADGKDLHRLTTLDSSVAEFLPTWSPDGQHIVFVALRGSPNPDNNYPMYIINPDGSDLHLLGNDPKGYAGPAFSPDGKLIAFHSMEGADLHNIYVMDIQGHHLVQLTHTGYAILPTWSPDGQKIAYQTLTDRNFDIWVMNADGSSQQQLTNGQYAEGFPSWSRDGKQIVFISNAVGPFHLYMMDADGSHQRRLTRDRDSEQFPSWQPGSS